MNDLRFAVRQLLKNPGFSAVAIITLALGIGANTAIFSLINTVLLRPLPFAKPHELASVWQEYPKRGWSHESLSLPNLLDLRAEKQVLVDAAGYSLSSHTLNGTQDSERLNTIRVSANLFSVLGVQAAQGRLFRAEDDHPEANRVTLLSDHLWERRYHRDPSLVGQSIQLNEEAVTVIGILPPNFRIGEENPDLCLPLRLDPAKVGRGQRGLQVIARLKPGLSQSQIKASLALTAARLQTADPWANDGVELSIVPLHEEFTGNARLSLLILGGAVGFVLLIACANIANLSLARASARRQELTIRAAIGASRWQIMRQLLAESLLLAFTGGFLGLALGWETIVLSKKLLAARLPQAADISLDMTVLVFTMTVSVATGILAGLFPALAASHVELSESLKEGTKSATSTRSRHWMRNALVTAEVSLAFVLLIGAGLLLKSLSQLRHVNPGFDPAQTLAVQTWLTGNRYNDNDAVRRATVRDLVSRLERIPGVSEVTFANSMVMAGEMDIAGTAVEGRTFAANEYPIVHQRGIGANYFKALRVPLMEGRYFTEADNETGGKVALINATMARRYWPQENPLGKRVRSDNFQSQEWLTIVGVVADVKDENLAQPPRPEIYFPYMQWPTRGLSLLLRTTVPPLTLAESIKREVWNVDRNLAIGNLRTLDQVLGNSFANAGFQSLLLGGFATMALLLATVGIYSVVACMVTQRSREIGIRTALGAQTRNIHALVIKSGTKPVLYGVILGGIASVGFSHLISRLLFQVSPFDPATFIAAAFMLVLTALGACLFPARRAAKVDPMESLRAE